MANLIPFPKKEDTDDQSVGVNKDYTKYINLVKDKVNDFLEKYQGKETQVALIPINIGVRCLFPQGVDEEGMPIYNLEENEFLMFNMLVGDLAVGVIEEQSLKVLTIDEYLKDDPSFQQYLYKRGILIQHCVASIMEILNDLLGRYSETSDDAEPANQEEE